MSHVNPSDADSLRREVGRFPWYHIIRLTDAVSTPGNPDYVPIQGLTMRALDSLDLRGKRVLDVGCRDGLFSFAAEARGAAEVVGIDSDLSKGATELLIPFMQSRVRMHRMNVLDLTPEAFGLFDVVIFSGVLYHLRYPFWGLRALRDVLAPGGHLLTETAVYEGAHGDAVLFCPVGDESPYESTSCSFFNEKGLADTLSSLGFSTLKVDLLRPRARVSRWEYLKAALTGRVPPRPINRGLFLSVYEGRDAGSGLRRYWEGVHDAHTGSPTGESLVV